jgi:chromosome segregation ATPase
MDTPSLQPSSPLKAPLLPTSPERINQQKIIHSPLSSDLHQKQSEVQAKIALINSLSRSTAQNPMPQSSSTASALQRAILGREEAESALARAASQLSEAQSRERRISERLESLLEELQATKERQVHERTIFEKEARKSRKEAFRASSNLVKVQEELRLAKGEIKSLKDEVRSEREAKGKANQEAFERAYALAGLTEELEVLKGRLRSFESDNRSDPLEAREKDKCDEADDERGTFTDKDTPSLTSPRRPKRSAGDDSPVKDSKIADLSLSQDDETPSKKARLSRRVSNKENQDPNDPEESEVIPTKDPRTEVEWERDLRIKAEDMVHFLKMECQFKRCSCRLAELQGVHYVHDTDWDKRYNKEHYLLDHDGDRNCNNKLLPELSTEQQDSMNRERTIATGKSV